MQLILNTDIDIGIQKKMSTLQQESLEEKFSNKSLIEEIVSDIDNITNGNNDCMDNQNVTELCKENGSAKVIVEQEIATESEAISESSLCTDVKESMDEKDTLCDVDKENGETIMKECTLEDNNKPSEAELETEEEENSKININESKNSEEVPAIENKQINEVIEESDKDDNKNKYEIYHPTTSETSQLDTEDNKINNETSKVDIAINLEQNEVKNVVEYEIQNDRDAVEESKTGNLEKAVSETENNKNDGAEELKEIIENNHTEADVEIVKEETEAETSNDCHTLSEHNDIKNLNTDRQLDSINEEITDTTISDMASDINKEDNIISKEPLLEEKHDDNKTIIEDVSSKMEVDDNAITVINNETCEDNPIIEENVVDHQCKDETKDVTNNIENDEIIDIADEKDEDLNSKTDENKSDFLKKQELKSTEKHDTFTQSKDNETNVANQELSQNIAEQQNDELDSGISDTDMKKSTEEPSSSDKKVDEKKTFTHISKLSNTLDILSDDEDLPNLINESEKNIKNDVDKQCINIIEDDDDIMLIDEESNSKDIEIKTENLKNPVMDNSKNEDCKEEYVIEECDQNKTTKMATDIKDIPDSEGVVKSEVKIDTSEPKEENHISENIKQIKPLLPVNFLKTCKKNLADMTRDELEEFCILKIVESVVDRSNLSEIKSQLKSMAQNIDEYKKKATALTKQNRDLQVVLKSVQEEQKKRSDTPITPLKITRSVGMQVLMTDKSGARRKPQQGSGASTSGGSSASPISRPGKSPVAQVSKPTKVTSGGSPSIPVPRLVPAVNNSNLNMKIQSVGPIPPGKPLAVASMPNGLTNLPPAQKPEKRPHSRTQSSGVTVDLTDDEPPAKLTQRNINPPVRLVNPQNLLAPNRQPFSANVNSPRKVYIPISGSQSQPVRAGQTIMLKAISPQGPRQRCPAPAVVKPSPSPNMVRMQRIANRHPAPLPDSMKQYQPHNWKALPPAPELKLSKVENGIVISWKIDSYLEDKHEEIASYQLYAYQETSSPPSTSLWKKIGDVKALPLPMACTLTQFMAGYKYYFAVRAVDVRSRLGPFSLPGSILLLNKM